jgi:hypothetical protein
MKLSDALPDIKTGDVVLFSGRGLWSWLIQVRTRSVYTHAGVVLRLKANGHERVSVLEALEPGGVRLHPLDRYVEAGETVDWYEVTDPAVNREAVASFALKQWGKRYAWRQVFWSFSRLAWLVRRLLGRPLRDVDPQRWFCSELVAAALAYAGCRTEEGIVPVETAPGDVARLTCLRRRGRLTP